MILAARKAKNTIFIVLFASGSENHGIYNVFFLPGRGKFTGIYAVFSMWQDVVSLSLSLYIYIYMEK